MDVYDCVADFVRVNYIPELRKKDNKKAPICKKCGLDKVNLNGEFVCPQWVWATFLPSKSNEPSRFVEKTVIPVSFHGLTLK